MELIIILLVVVFLLSLINSVIAIRLFSFIQKLEQKLDLIPKHSAELITSKYLKLSITEPRLPAQKESTEKIRSADTIEKPEIFKPVNATEFAEEKKDESSEKDILSSLNESKKSQVSDVSKKFNKFLIIPTKSSDEGNNQDEYKWR